MAKRSDQGRRPGARRPGPPSGRSASGKESQGGRRPAKGGTTRSERPASSKRSDSTGNKRSDFSAKKSGQVGGKKTYPGKKTSTAPFKRRSDENEPRFGGPRPSRPDSSRKRSGDDKPRRKFERKDSDKDFKPKSRGGFTKRASERSGEALGRSRGRHSSSKPSHFQAETPVQTEKIRLNRYIANSGVCSRREADELIKMGLISVNGKTITELGFKVNPGDEVRYEDRVLRAEKPVYILLNKPKGYLTTTSDPQERNTVMHLIGDKIRERIYPVGRLDRNTTGLLLLTNDGDLADKLMHPSYNVKKIYKVELDRPLTKSDFQKIQEGVRLEEGVAQIDDIAIVSDDGKTVGIEIHIGWNRVVRRIFEALEYQVVKLDRSVYAGLDKKDLSRGQWRFLRQEEIVRLKHYK